MASRNLHHLETALLTTCRARVLKCAERYRAAPDNADNEFLLHTAIMLYASAVSQNNRSLEALERVDVRNPAQRCGEEILPA